MTSAEGLQKFLDEHPTLSLSEQGKLIYRAGFTDGQIATLDRMLECLNERIETNG